MKIWHDNSGKRDEASWFLKFIVVHDLQTREKFYFICQEWLAVEKSDSKLERELFVACEPQKVQAKYLIKKQLENNFSDFHLWLSVFTRPAQSSFTRLDRVTCCFVLLYMSLLVVNLYYCKIYKVSNTQAYLFTFSLICITWEQVTFILVYYLSRLTIKKTPFLV